jgi:hypothetical protein
MLTIGMAELTERILGAVVVPRPKKPEPSIRMRSSPAVETLMVFDAADQRPELALPTKERAGLVAVPRGRTKAEERLVVASTERAPVRMEAPEILRVAPFTKPVELRLVLETP